MPAPTFPSGAANHTLMRESSGGNGILILACKILVTERKVRHAPQLSSSLIFTCHYASSSLTEPGTKTALHHKAPKTVTWAENPKQEEEKVSQEALEQRKLQRLEKAGIKVLPAAARYSRFGRTSMGCAALVLGQLTNKCR